MKEAIIVDIDGFYVEPVIVSLTEQGVTEIYETPQSTEEMPEPEPIFVGYRVAVPVPPGLYKPKLDIAAWQAALKVYAAAIDAYRDALIAYYGSEEGVEPQYPDPIDLAAFWVEGLTQAEIDVIVNAPKPVTAEERIADLEAANDALKVKAQIAQEIASATSADFQDFMDFYFSQ